MCWLQHAAQLWHYPHFLLDLLALLGAIECFAGYQAWRMLVGVNGAVIGLCAGFFACVVLQCPTVAPLGALIGLIAGAALCASVLTVGTFIFSLFTGASAALLVALLTGLPDGFTEPLVIAAGVLTAAVALLKGRAAIIVIAALSGAQQLSSIACAYGLSLVWRDDAPPTGLRPWECVAFVALAGVGLLIQFGTSHAAEGAGPPPNPEAPAKSSQAAG